jgi:hypothetical protein
MGGDVLDPGVKKWIIVGLVLIVALQRPLGSVPMVILVTRISIIYQKHHSGTQFVSNSTNPGLRPSIDFASISGRQGIVCQSLLKLL